MSLRFPTTLGQDATRSNSDIFYRVDKAVGGVYAAKVERTDLRQRWGKRPGKRKRKRKTMGQVKGADWRCEN
jgi:hypothetical protein